MKTITYLLPVLLLSCAVLVAGEKTLLEQIQAETRTLAEAANQAVVRVSGRHAVKFHPSGVRNHYPAYVATETGLLYYTTTSRTASYGVLVGSPAKLVMPYNSAKQVSVTLADRRTTTAKLLDADADLGIAVYGLPAKLAAKLRGLELARDWSDLRAGSVAVQAGTEVGLSLVRRSYPQLGWLYGGDAKGGVALIGPRRKLLGLSSERHATVANSASCAQCHTAPNSNYVRAEAAFLVASNQTAPTGKAPHGYIGGPVIARVLDDIAKHGRIRHGYLGVVLGSASKEGVLVTSVLEGSPAAKAGLRAGCRVLSIDGLRTRDGASLSRALVLKRPGDAVMLSWRQPGAAQNKATGASIKMGDRTAAQASLVTEETLGMSCMDIGPELRKFFNLGDDVKGVALSDVRRNGPAYKAGLRRGDVITWGDNAAVADLEELRALLASAKGRVQLHAKRSSNGQTLVASIKIPDVSSKPR